MLIGLPVCQNVFARLKPLHNFFSFRNSCILCKSTERQQTLRDQSFYNERHAWPRLGCAALSMRERQTSSPCIHHEKRTIMEHLDTGTLEDWYANRAKPAPALLRRLAVIAPDDAPGLSALRQRLAQRGPQSLNCDHFAAGFNGKASVSLASAFEQIRQRHQADPYDIVLLLEGRPDALGIAESNGLIPEQVSRMPAPVWTAIGEDDANTELGDVANRVFPNPGVLIDALPFPAVQPQAGKAYAEPSPDFSPEPSPEPAHQPVADPAFTLVTTPAETVPSPLLTLPSRHGTLTPERASAHPLVLCAAGAVIVASITAVAAMMGWLPSRAQADVGGAGRAAATALTPPAATPATSMVTSRPAAPAASVVNEGESIPAVLPAATTAEPETGQAAPLPSTPPVPQGSGMGGGAALAAAGAAGVMAAGAGERAASPAPAPAKRARRTPRRQPEPPFAQARAPRQVGSTEVPSVDFVGTKSRQQVIAELMEARRMNDRQAANGNYFSAPGGRSVRR
jgi:hypothetical protein